MRPAPGSIRNNCNSLTADWHPDHFVCTGSAHDSRKKPINTIANPALQFPPIIQGGMGAGVSDWRLARSVSIQGQIGVVSGTALDLILVRRLQLGDSGGHLRRALAAFPDPEITDRILARYFIEGGKAPDRPFVGKQMVGDKPGRQLEELLVAANFVEVHLAKEGHDGRVGINYLHKIQAPLLASLYGAMLAGVDLVLVGAGIPIEIPEIIDRLTRSDPVESRLQIRKTEPGREHWLTFDPGQILKQPPGQLRRPLFFPIVSSASLAGLLVKKGQGRVDGLIIEGPTAGGHNAPPRGKPVLSPAGEPIYGERDAIDLGAIRALGVPFFLAGSYGGPEKLREALEAGATGIQVGTLFAFSDESGMRTDLKRDLIRQCQNQPPRVFTDPLASPTGFPIKILSLPDTLSEPGVYGERKRRCDLGYLREAYECPDGTLGWRCPSDDPEVYLKSGGNPEDSAGRKCLCNGLMANIGLPQIRAEHTVELPLVTCGDDLQGILQVVGPEADAYSSKDVIAYLLDDRVPGTGS